MSTPDAFRAEIERYLAITGMSPTRFGMMAAGDPRFVFDIRKKNREPRSATVKRVTDFMSKPLSKPEERAA
jgi:hypothetical protein